MNNPAAFGTKALENSKKFTISEWIGFVNPSVDKHS